MKTFYDVVRKCKGLCMQCNMLACHKVDTNREPIAETDLAMRVNPEALTVLKELSLKYSSNMFLVTSVNPYANKMPEICAVFGANDDELDKIGEFYDEALEGKVGDFGEEYDGISMVHDNDFDINWLTSTETVFFVKRGEFFIRVF